MLEYRHTSLRSLHLQVQEMEDSGFVDAAGFYDREGKHL